MAFGSFGERTANVRLFFVECNADRCRAYSVIVDGKRSTRAFLSIDDAKREAEGIVGSALEWNV